MGVAGGCAISLGDVGRERLSACVAGRGVASLQMEGSGLVSATSSCSIGNAFCMAGASECDDDIILSRDGAAPDPLLFELTTFLINIL